MDFESGLGYLQKSRTVMFLKEKQFTHVIDVYIIQNEYHIL